MNHHKFYTLLLIIFYRASRLWRLRLLMCEISDKGFREFVKFSLLEKIEIVLYKNISKDTLEVIGQCSENLDR